MLLPKEISFILLLFCCWWFAKPAEAQLTIAREGTANPTLLYRGEPMLAVGPVPEVALFAVQAGSKYLSQEAWLDWMQQHGMGYGRVYPESGFPWVPYDADRRVFPFQVARWEKGKPLMDITRWDEAYWRNMAQVIQQCADRGIVLQMQLYQRVFFADKNKPGRWNGNYFHPKNNINRIPVPEGSGGYGIFRAMTRDPFWKDMHTRWVTHVLEAIGDKGNVILDLMNEGSSHAVDRAWIEYTLDIIEDWEQKTGNRLLVGMDFDHYHKRNDKDLPYVLSHPRMELLIGEGSEGHVVPDLVAGDRRTQQQHLSLHFRQRYKKPMLSTNSPNLGLHEGIHDLLLYQWYALMTKVQGAGVYAKEYPLDFSNASIKAYAAQTKVMVDFFAGLQDYTRLEVAPDMIAAAPTRYQLALSSDQELVIYLHTGVQDRALAAGTPLTMHHVSLPDGPVTVTLINPATGATIQVSGTVKQNKCYITLPAFTTSLVAYVLPAAAEHP